MIPAQHQVEETRLYFDLAVDSVFCSVDPTDTDNMNATTPMPLNDEWTDLSSEARSTLLNELTRVADPTRIAVTRELSLTD